MKQPRCKKQPTRDDLAIAWKMIRGQTQIIKLLTERLRRQERVLGSTLMVYPRLEELRANYALRRDRDQFMGGRLLQLSTRAQRHAAKTSK
jgi:hypothetical protein